MSSLLDFIIDASTMPSGSILQVTSSGNTFQGISFVGAQEDAIVLSGATATNNNIFGNFIGLNADGTAFKGNGGYGVRIQNGASNNILGTNGDDTTDASERNIISGNSAGGIIITGTGSENNVVAGNLFGLELDAQTILTNSGHGIEIVDEAKNNIIGSQNNDVVERNIIKNSLNDGIFISDLGTFQNTISFNEFGDNGDLAIDLAPNGVNANDVSDIDAGPNTLLNSPEIVNVLRINSNTLQVDGVVDIDTDPTNAVIEIYTTTSGTGAGVQGEGEEFIQTVNPDVNGQFSLEITTDDAIITATVTDENGNTSEFGQNVQAVDQEFFIRGTIFEDTNFNGLTSTGFEIGTDFAFENVVVELYTSTGALQAQDITDVNGAYEFIVNERTDYTVRTVSSTIGDIDTQPATGRVGGILDEIIPEQTFEFDGQTFNGEAGALGGNNKSVDDTATASGAGVGDTNFTTTLTGSGNENLDFGFSYNLVVNNNDSGQGSLRQFIENANTVEGPNTSIFDIDGSTVIIPLTAYPIVSNSGTIIDGYSQAGTNRNTNEGTVNTDLEIDILGSVLTGSDALLQITSDNNRVTGLALRNGPWDGIVLSGNRSK